MKFVVAKHPTNGNKYLFTVPTDVTLDPLTDIIVKTRRSNHEPAKTITGTFTVTGEEEIREICHCYGTYPEQLQPVIGVRYVTDNLFDTDQERADKPKAEPKKPKSTEAKDYNPDVDDDEDDDEDYDDQGDLTIGDLEQILAFFSYITEILTDMLDDLKKSCDT